MTSLLGSTFRPFLRIVFALELRKFATTPALHAARGKQNEPKGLNNMPPSTSIGQGMEKCWKKCINIHEHIASWKVSKQITQIKYPMYFDAIINHINKQLQHLQNKLHVSDEFVKQVRKLVPTLVLHFIMSMSIGCSDQEELKNIAFLASPILLWTMVKKNSNVVRLITNVIIVSAKYGIDRYQRLVSSDDNNETEVPSNLSEGHITHFTDSENKVFEEESKIPNLTSENILSEEEVSVIVSLVVKILTVTALPYSLGASVVAQQLAASQWKKLTGDILKFLSQPEQENITSEIKSDLTCIKNSVNESIKSKL